MTELTITCESKGCLRKLSSALIDGGFEFECKPHLKTISVSVVGLDDFFNLIKESNIKKIKQVKIGDTYYNADGIEIY